MNKVYIVTMYRWGSRESHSYVLGAWSNKITALTAAECEDYDRAGKYVAEVICAVGSNLETIIELEAVDQQDRS